MAKVDLSKIPPSLNQLAIPIGHEWWLDKATAVHSTQPGKPPVTTFGELVLFLRANLSPIKNYSPYTLPCIRSEIDKRFGYVLKPVLAAALIEAGFSIHNATWQINCSTKSKLWQNK